MAMISDADYALQAIRLSALRYTDDPLSPRLITVDPAFALNPYINAAGLSDIDRWPELKRALDSPPPDWPSSYESARHARAERAHRERSRDRRGEREGERAGGGGGAGGLQYTQTIMGPYRSGGAGMRVTGKRTAGEGRRGNRANSSEALSPRDDEEQQQDTAAGQGSGSVSARRPRADSAPARGHVVDGVQQHLGASLRAGALSTIPAEVGSGSAVSFSETSGEVGDEDRYVDALEDGNLGIGTSARPHQLAATALDTALDGPNVLAQTMLDDGSDMDGDYDDDDYMGYHSDNRPDSRSSSIFAQDPISFSPIPLASRSQSQPTRSALTSLLNKHIPHLVSTSSAEPDAGSPAPAGPSNPFASLYTSVALPPGTPGQAIELYFPHSDDPATPLVVNVRKDATVEEVTGFGLYRFWEEQRGPLLSEEEEGVRWSSFGWGLRIVEDDGEVDEDFPPLDRESKISKFSYGQFAIVEASPAQIKQNTSKQPHIQRRPSRIIAPPSASASQHPSRAASHRPTLPSQPSEDASTLDFSDSEEGHGAAQGPQGGSNAPPRGSYGFPSTLGALGMQTQQHSQQALQGMGQVLMRVRVMASNDMQFTTTISVPEEMYIADLTETLCRKKRLALPASDWVMCLADLSLALPVDRTVASLQGQTDLALVRSKWAVERGLGTGDRRGGDPNASIFKRQSDIPSRFGSGVPDLASAYKKYKVHRKIAIGRHERVLAIDGDYIHIMPSENRAFFDSLKTTSFHISLVTAIKLSGRSGGFKVNVWREGAPKRYEFEAENGRQAQEIVDTIKALMRTHQAERSSMLPPPRTLIKR